MRVLRLIRNYIFYCGIEKDEYKTLKKDAYVSNFEVWRVLHCLMVAVFAGLFIVSLKVELVAPNRMAYLLLLLYSAAAACLFLFVFKPDSLVAQFIIYLSISMLFVFGCLITQNKPNAPATTFVVLLLITPMFMIDKPYFMAIELIIASIVYLSWMHDIKAPDVWKMDFGNIIAYSIIGIFLHVVANTIRIKEFVLARKIAIQKDQDDLTGLKNKGAVTRAINEYLADESKQKGILFLLDIDHFKSVNDTYGHDVGDDVIRQLGAFLHDTFTSGEIVGRFGGDEFIVFLQDADGTDVAVRTAHTIVDGAAGRLRTPDEKQAISVSIGIAVYHGEEKNYSEIFKKADVALYHVKSDRKTRFEIYREAE